MRAVVQRVSGASVEVEGEVVGSIDAGLLVYLGAGKQDDESDARWMADKVASLRIFQDDAGKMSRSVAVAGGAVLVVSQFTLLADVRKGRRPSWAGAAAPESAEPLIGRLAEGLRAHGIPVSTGRFGSLMQDALTNDGPVTIVVDTQGGTIA